jgi:hypothetical protein
MMLRVIARPRPLPPCSRDRLSSRRTKRPKIFSLSLTGTGAPSSSTVTTTV